jgi:hypothetical protein
LASAELRSVNAQVEYLLREALKLRTGKATPPVHEDSDTTPH